MCILAAECRCIELGLVNNPTEEVCPACKDWWRLHPVLKHETRADPGLTPCIEDPDACIPPGAHPAHYDPPDPDAIALFNALKVAAEASR
jgi:hypothetical protein